MLPYPADPCDKTGGVSNDNGDKRMLLRPWYVAFLHPFSLDVDTHLRLADRRLLRCQRMGTRVGPRRRRAPSARLADPSSHARAPHYHNRNTTFTSMPPFSARPSYLVPSICRNARSGNARWSIKGSARRRNVKRTNTMLSAVSLSSWGWTSCKVQGGGAHAVTI